MEITPPPPPRRLRSDATPFSEHPRAKYWSKKNKLKPHEVALNSNTKFLFDCPECPHEFACSPSNINYGGNWCPYCKNKRLCGDIECILCFNKSFASHKKAEYWSDKNKLKPHQVCLGSDKKIWFDCGKCPHEFVSRVANVSRLQRWCPYCCKSPKLCGDIKCEFCLKKSFAIHKRAKCWSDKNELKPHQVALNSGKKCWFDCDKCPHDFDSAVGQVSNGSWCPYCCIPCKKLCGNIECKFCFKKSFASHKKAKYWSKKNKLKPHQVCLGSNKTIWFDCDKCHHDFDSLLSNVCKEQWCPYCCIPCQKLCGDIKCEFCFKKSFASHKRAKCWSAKNKLKPREVTLHSSKKYWFDCDKCLHDFDSLLSNVSNGSWCPYCSNHKICGKIECEFCLKKSFASHEKAKYWSKKNTLKPHQVSLSSGTKRWFNCPTCSHDFDSELFDVQRGRWCPYCCIHPKLCGDIKCEFCFKKSFASHKRAKCWSSKNKLKPHEVTLNSGTKCWFDCDKCPHDFESALYNVNNGRWCPYCKNKTEKKLLEWFKKQSWVKKVKHQYKPKWFKYHCIIKGEPEIRSFHYSYDFLVTFQNGKQVIIELDGVQHYRDVLYFKSIALHQQIRDAYKERKARQHKLKVIRILQEDVWYDRNDWEETLTHKLKSFQ